jgi:hypothetical protein
MIQALANSLLSGQTSLFRGQLQARVAKNALDVQKMEGAALIKMMEQSSVAPAPPTDPSKGANIDLYA